METQLESGATNLPMKVLQSPTCDLQPGNNLGESPSHWQEGCLHLLMTFSWPFRKTCTVDQTRKNHLPKVRGRKSPGRLPSAGRSAQRGQVAPHLVWFLRWSICCWCCCAHGSKPSDGTWRPPSTASPWRAAAVPFAQLSPTCCLRDTGKWPITLSGGVAQQVNRW